MACRRACSCLFFPSAWAYIYTHTTQSKGHFLARICANPQIIPIIQRRHKRGPARSTLKKAPKKIKPNVTSKKSFGDSGDSTLEDLEENILVQSTKNQQHDSMLYNPGI
jgi:hypothetical protein